MPTIEIEVTPEQWRRWQMAASTTDLSAYLAKAADFYAERLAARLELARRLEREGKL